MELKDAGIWQVDRTRNAPVCLLTLLWVSRTRLANDLLEEFDGDRAREATNRDISDTSGARIYNGSAGAEEGDRVGLGEGSKRAA